MLPEGVGRRPPEHMHFPLYIFLVVANHDKFADFQFDWSIIHFCIVNSKTKQLRKMKVCRLSTSFTKETTIVFTRFLPTKNNRCIWRLDREIRSLILNIANERREGWQGSSKNDLLQSIIDGASAIHAKPSTIDGFIIDNCKSIYFAGHETTATTATWCLMLLASHPEWQDRARAEVLEVCQGRLPDADMLHGLKTVSKWGYSCKSCSQPSPGKGMLTMVIRETLRLYPPAALVTREAFQDMKLGGIYIPKGITLSVLISVLHHDPEFWGPDANEFNPERFAHGISGACKSAHAYIPFGVGIRTCAGQNFAMLELKIVLSLLLSKFSFSPSPKYIHSPAFRLTIEPEFGVPLIVKKL